MATVGHLAFLKTAPSMKSPLCRPDGVRPVLRQILIVLVLGVALTKSPPVGAHPHTLDELLRLSLCQLLRLTFVPASAERPLPEPKPSPGRPS